MHALSLHMYTYTYMERDTYICMYVCIIVCVYACVHKNSGRIWNEIGGDKKSRGHRA